MYWVIAVVWKRSLICEGWLKYTKQDEESQFWMVTKKSKEEMYHPKKNGHGKPDEPK